MKKVLRAPDCSVGARLRIGLSIVRALSIPIEGGTFHHVVSVAVAAILTASGQLWLAVNGLTRGVRSLLANAKDDRANRVVRGDDSPFSSCVGQRTGTVSFRWL